MTALVGYTGFVGSNIYAEGKIEAVYNSRNIREAFGTRPELLIFAGLRAEKYLANSAPEKDLALVLEAEENIQRICPKKLVLISSIDVFRDPKGKDETAEIETEGLNAYGYNRYLLELWVKEHFEDPLIIRLPGLFGRNIKKNFIYDYINVIPFMLNGQKMKELSGRDPGLTGYYDRQENGFYRVKELTPEERLILKERFRKLGFSALNFTDSRSRYQFYPLQRLWKDIGRALDAGLTIWHPATEPVSAGEVYEYLTGKPFVNHLPGLPADYDYRTKYAALFGGTGGYISGRDEILAGIRRFVEGTGTC